MTTRTLRDRPNSMNRHRDELRDEITALKQDFDRVQADLRDITDELIDSGRDAARHARDSVSRAAHESRDAISRHPIAFCVGAAGVGLLAGALVAWNTRR